METEQHSQTYAPSAYHQPAASADNARSDTNLSFNITDYDDKTRAQVTVDEVDSLEALPVESQVILIVLYSATILLAVTGNIIVILVFTLGKRSRTDLRGFLINLAIADLIMAVFCLPFTFTSTMLKNWIFSPPMCPLVLYMQTVSVTASVCTNMAIGIDRFWVVTFPLKSRRTKSRTKFVIVGIWLVALGLSSIQLVVGRVMTYEASPGKTVMECVEIWPEPSEPYRRGYTFFILILTYLMPLSILSLTYGMVGIKLWQRTAPGNADEQRDHMQLKSKRKVIKMLVMVVVFFGICWLPLHVFILVLDFNPDLVQYETPRQEKFFIAIYYCVHWLAMSNSFVNPIIYGFLNDNFRSDLKRLWRKWFPCCKCSKCLQKPLLETESSIAFRDMSAKDKRYLQRTASTKSQLCSKASNASNDPTKRLLTVKMNGTGKYESELHTNGKEDTLKLPRVHGGM